ncbi:MAG: class I SAM-dependent methyltransferase [Gemmatimonadaceae bacterium]
MAFVALAVNPSQMDEHSPAELDPAIRAYYDQAPEEARLEVDAFQLEALRTRELIERHAPRPPATVLDVGGAAGAYAAWLASAGYTVHLVDAVPRLVAEARRRSAALPRPIASCEVGDARALSFPTASADIVLLLGPLYHLTTSGARAQALAEATRVLKAGGLLFAAAISRWASALDGLARDLFQDPRFSAIVEQDLRDGQHRNPTDRVDYFTTAYFHHPEELRAEVVHAGLVMEGLYGLEGPAWILPDFAERWADARRRSDVLRLARAFEAEPSVLGVSAHLLAVARKPGDKMTR